MSTPNNRRGRRFPWSRREPHPAQDLASPGIGGVAAPSPQFVAAPRLGDTFRALRHRNYRLFYTGQAISLSGTWMQTIAQAWLVIEITDSQAALGLVVTLQFLPITLFVLFAGVIADRVPKRSFLVFTQVLAMTQAVILTSLVWTGYVELWHVYVLAFMFGVATALEQPTRQAFVMEMVGREDLLNAVALNSGLFNGASLVGPAIGGVVIATAGLEIAFLLNAISFVPVIAGLLMMDLSQLHRRKPAEAPKPLNAVAELREGISYAFKTPATMLIIILVAIVGTFGYNFNVVLPIVARYVLDAGSAELGFLTASVGLGALLSALMLARRRTASRSTIFIGGAAFAVLLAAVAVSQSFYITLALLLVLGIANTAFAATANTSLQLATPDHLRGRVMALYMLLFAGSTPIGAYLTGYLAEHIGDSEAILILAAMCLVGVVAGMLYYVSHRAEVVRTEDAGGLSEARAG